MRACVYVYVSFYICYGKFNSYFASRCDRRVPGTFSTDDVQGRISIAFPARSILVHCCNEETLVDLLVRLLESQHSSETPSNKQRIGCRIENDVNYE